MHFFFFHWNQIYDLCWLSSFPQNKTTAKARCIEVVHFKIHQQSKIKQWHHQNPTKICKLSDRPLGDYRPANFGNLKSKPVWPFLSNSSWYTRPFNWNPNPTQCTKLGIYVPLFWCRNLTLLRLWLALSSWPIKSLVSFLCGPPGPDATFHYSTNPLTSVLYVSLSQFL